MNPDLAATVDMTTVARPLVKNADAVAGPTNTTNPVARKEKFNDFDFYVIFSTWSLMNIEKHLTSMRSRNSYVGPLKIEYGRDHRESDRTVLFMSPDMYQAIKNRNYNGFGVEKYKVRSEINLERKSLCIPIPKNLGMTGTEIRKIIERFLVPLFRLEHLRPQDVVVTVPITSRETDMPKGVAYINFEDHVSNELIAVLSRSIVDSRWGTADYYMICHFSRSNVPRRRYDTVTGTSHVGAATVASDGFTTVPSKPWTKKISYKPRQ